MLQESQLPELLEIPEAFRAAHYCPAELLTLLNFDKRYGETAEYEFWRAYKRGFIPPGVWLPTNEGFCVWEREFIRQWVEAGCPPMANVVEHENRVHLALIAAVENRLPTLLSERN